MTEIVVPCDLDLAAASEALAGFRARVSAAGQGPVALNLDGPGPTVPALQILLALAAALTRAGVAMSPGTHAASYLAAVLPEPEA